MLDGGINSHFGTSSLLNPMIRMETPAHFRPRQSTTKGKEVMLNSTLDAADE